MGRKLTETEILLGRSENYYDMSAQEQWDEDKRLGILDWDSRDEEYTGRLLERAMERAFQTTPEGPLKSAMEKQRHNRAAFKDVFTIIDDAYGLPYPSEEQRQGAAKALMLVGNYLLNRPI
jgi:hypothetical protein